MEILILDGDLILHWPGGRGCYGWRPIVFRQGAQRYQEDGDSDPCNGLGANDGVVNETNTRLAQTMLGVLPAIARTLKLNEWDCESILKNKFTWLTFDHV